jgi:NAD(P)-dependent dehydrogenase (short-subunit alcohol dehydrogenase family)
MSTDDQTRRDGASVGARHLLLVGAGPGLGAAIARRFAREAYRVTLVTRSPSTTAPFAQELRATGADVTTMAADAGDPQALGAALAPLFTAPGAPGVVVYNAALMTFDDLLTVSPQQLADAYAVDVIGDDGIHAGRVTILGQIAPGTPFDPDGIAEAYWAISAEEPAAWREEYRFAGAAIPDSAGVR